MSVKLCYLDFPAIISICLSALKSLPSLHLLIPSLSRSCNLVPNCFLFVASLRFQNYIEMMQNPLPSYTFTLWLAEENTFNVSLFFRAVPAPLHLHLSKCQVSIFTKSYMTLVSAIQCHFYLILPVEGLENTTTKICSGATHHSERRITEALTQKYPNDIQSLPWSSKRRETRWTDSKRGRTVLKLRHWVGTRRTRLSFCLYPTPYMTLDKSLKLLCASVSLL